MKNKRKAAQKVAILKVEMKLKPNEVTRDYSIFYRMRMFMTQHS